MMAFDNKGRYISGDYLLVLFARYLETKHVVTTGDVSKVIEDYSEVMRTPVGDIYVSGELLKGGDFRSDLREHGYSREYPTALMAAWLQLYPVR